MTATIEKQYVAEVVYRDDRGNYRVIILPKLKVQQVKQLAVKEYGVRMEWIVEVYFVEKPQFVPEEEDVNDAFCPTDLCRRLLASGVIQNLTKSN